MTKDTWKVLLYETPAKILVHLKENGNTYVLKMTHELGLTYSHVTRSVSRMENMGLIKSERRKKTENRRGERRKNIQLTFKGYQVAEYLDGIMKELE